MRVTAAAYRAAAAHRRGTHSSKQTISSLVAARGTSSVTRGSGTARRMATALGAGALWRRVALERSAYHRKRVRRSAALPQRNVIIKRKSNIALSAA